MSLSVRTTRGEPLKGTTATTERSRAAFSTTAARRHFQAPRRHTRPNFSVTYQYQRSKRGKLGTRDAWRLRSPFLSRDVSAAATANRLVARRAAALSLL
jgi:hypothetical protein